MQLMSTPPRSGPRMWIAQTAGQLAAWASRTMGRGSGTSIRGAVIRKLYPESFATLLAGRHIAAVTGTNGKTTTTHLLAAAVRESLHTPTRRVVTNADGANLHHGIVSALAMAPQADIAVLETDERVVADLIKHGHPEVLVLLNFSRDQLDRNFEIKFLAREWKNALAEVGSAGPVVVANAKDPLVVWAAHSAKRAVWVDTGEGWTQDSALCPACGALLARDESRWSCPSCDLAEPDADYVLLPNDRVRLPDGTTVSLILNVPGRFNRSNAACALAAAVQFGIPIDATLAGMSTVRSPAGRFSVGTFGTTQARLILAKNPAGWAESLTLTISDPVVLAIDAAAADGRDVSWMWDVNFERLRGRHVVCTGPRAQDLAVRLAYADVDHSIEPDLEAAISPLGGSVDVLSTYTPFQRLLDLGGLR